MRNLLLSACCLLAGPAALAATMASQPWVTNRIAEAVAAIPQPGNYATVSNRAMSALQSHQNLQPSTNYTDAALAEFARTNKVLKAGPYIPTAGGTATNTVTVTTGGPAILELVRPWSSLERGAISFGDLSGGWTFDSSGLHRHIRTPFGTTLGGAFTFPEDAYETGGELALRSDIPNVDMSAASNYTDAVAAEFEDGTREVDYASDANTAFYLAGDDDTYNATDLIRESTNAAIAVCARKQDALPYPTNAIPYAAIDGAPSGGPEWTISVQDGDFIQYVTNGMARVRWWDYTYTDISDMSAWPDGAAMFVRFEKQQPITSWTVGNRIHLVGYGTWPTNNFQSVWWRSGTTIYVNILLEE